MAKIVRKGHGQLELNQVAFPRDGRVEAQIPFSGSDGDFCENGMILFVDKVNNVAKYSTGATDDLFAIVYTSEELYSSSKGLKDFYLKMEGDQCVGVDGFNVYPRLGYLSAGDRFTTNAIDDTSVDAEPGKYGKVGTKGYIEISDAAGDYGPVLKVVKKTTMPDGQEAVQFVVISEQSKGGAEE